MRHRCMFVLALICLSLAGSSFALSQLVSDDFNAYNLKTSIWTLTDPLGDATLTLTGTGTADASLTLIVPEGKSHELWTSGYNIPRIMQPVSNTDFDVEVKFRSTVSKAYQMQGVIIEQDTSNLLRVEFNSAGGDVRLFAASFSGGLASPVIRVNTDIGALVEPLYLRIHRSGSTWVLSYSTNGTNWTSGGIFVHTMAVSKVGLFAGNSGGETAPADTAVIDYFYNGTTPFSSEDSAQTVADAVPPLIYDVKVLQVAAGLRVTWKTDEPATSSVEYGKTTAYEGGVQTVPGTSLSHSVDLTGLTGGTLYNIRITSNDNHPNNKGTTGNYTATTLVAPTITVWYGTTQDFATLGHPQRNADILGNVSATSRIVSLTYTLNGGQAQDLSLGPDGRLLEMPGDFKINLPYASLQNGANTVVISALDSAGIMTKETVTVNHHPGTVWRLPYAVSWTGTKSLTDSAQVVDGKWERTAQGAHISQSGYDRAIAIGDTTWKNYEVTAEITVNRIDSTAEAFNAANGGPAIGFMFRWVGHTDKPDFVPPVTQPTSGYLPLGALGWYHWQKGFTSNGANQWEIYGNNLILRDKNSDAANAIHYGTTYMVKMQVSTIADTIPYYRLKFWPAGQAEPEPWLLNAQEHARDPQYGSVLILVHHLDATLGRVTVTPLGSDAVPPQIGSIEVEAGSHSAYITWGTDELTTSKIAFGTTTAHADTATGTGPASYDHGLQLFGLTSSTLYHFVVIAIDTAGNTTVSKDSTFMTRPPSSPTTFVSDDFNGAMLNTGLWTFVNPPPGGASVSKQPTTISFHVPGGSAHDLWTTGYQVPRLMQPVNNADFYIEIKFDSPLSERFQSQGLVIEQDSLNVLRLDFDGNGSETRIFAASFANGLGSPVIIVDSLVGGNGTLPLLMRIKREDNIWTYSYSLNGVSWTTVATFHHTMIVRKIGVFAGNAGSSPPTLDAIVDYIRTVGSTSVSAQVSVKALLEGAYAVASDTMSTRLGPAIPKTQPYGVAPWNYLGIETVTSVPASVVDWVLVELRNDTAAAAAVSRRAGFLLKDGRVVDIDGASSLAFAGVGPNNYYIVVHHRNHLAVMTAAPVHIDSVAVLYDFTTGQNKAYGPNAMKPLGSRFGLYVGDANMDGQVTSLDFDQFNPKFRAAATGYQNTDWNMDAQVTSLDFDLFNPNFRAAAVCRVPN